MKIELQRNRSKGTNDHSFSLDRKLASYLAASASIGAVIATDANAIIISNPTTQNVGINGVANIDFNSDGQVDFQIDHDRVDLTPQGGPVVDYLQLDKNDINGELDPLPFDPLTGFQAATFAPNGTTANDANNSAYLVENVPGSGHIQYPNALLAGAEIGVIPPGVPNQQKFDFQEGGNVFGTEKAGRLNRLIDEDHGQVDMLLGGKTENQIVVPENTPQFLGVVDQVRYLGVRMDLNNASAGNAPGEFNYGWIGIKITDEANATAQVVGYGYQTEPGISILAGDTGARAGDYNNDGKVDAADYVLWKKGGTLQNETVTPGTVTAGDYTAWRLNYAGTTTSGSGVGLGSTVPEPGSALVALASGFCLICVYIGRRLRGK